MLPRRGRGPGRMPMAHALARAARSVQGTLHRQKRAVLGRRSQGEASSAGNDAKGVRAKFRDGVARAEQRVILNFDLTPFASGFACAEQRVILHLDLTPFALTPFPSTQDLRTINHLESAICCNAACQEKNLRSIFLQ